MKNYKMVVSYDGTRGSQSYGRELPPELGCRRVLLRAGLSTQALLLGKKEVTHEALYVSKNINTSLAQPDLFLAAA